VNIRPYVVQHDKGFAPNPFYGVCTLACCKPRIRKKAVVGDIIIGFGSAAKAVNLGGRVIYWMKVAEIITFDEYWSDERFRRKRPTDGGSLMQWYGDNIYHRDPETGSWIQEHSFHFDGARAGRGNLENDTTYTDRVLIGLEYAYWGRAAPRLPDRLSFLVPRLRAEPCHWTEEQVAECAEWIYSLPERGFLDEPADWARDHRPGEDKRLPSISSRVRPC
jgi:hypothetical protein